MADKTDDNPFGTNRYNYKLVFEITMEGWIAHTSEEKAKASVIDQLTEEIKESLCGTDLKLLTVNISLREPENNGE